MRWPTRVLAACVTAGAMLPRVALPLAATACDICPDSGSPAVLDRATVVRAPQIVAEGESCTTQGLSCIHRDELDRCDTYWITAIAEGTCIFSVRFDDGTRIEDVIAYERDDDWPCRGGFYTPNHHVTKINSGS